FFSVATSSFNSVVLPTPAGPATRKKMPRPIIPSNDRAELSGLLLTPHPFPLTPAVLLQILHLLPDLFDQALHVHHSMRDRILIGLRADRVDLAKEFLRQEVEFLADFAAASQRRFHLDEMALQARHLFA